jgi:hypothetical protein
LFGLSNSEANHGEDVKEYYFYLDSTPTHSYMKYLYKYPQASFPYDDLVKTNSQRSRQEFEYELMDTGVFDQDRYFDVFVEYAKETPEDILIQITAWNRAPEAAVLYVLPNLWFRNTWDWYPFTEKPLLSKGTPGEGFEVIAASHPELGERYLYCEAVSSLLFTENETNQERLFGQPNPTPFVKAVTTATWSITRPGPSIPCIQERKLLPATRSPSPRESRQSFVSAWPRCRLLP